MKKNVLLLILIISFFFTTGWSWNTIKNAAGKDNVNAGIKCEYNFTNTIYNDIEKVDFVLNENELSVIFNNSYRTTLVTSSNNPKTEKATFNNVEYKISHNFIKELLSYYKKKNSCLATVYIDEKNKAFNISQHHSPGDPIKDYAYTLSSKTITTTDGQSINCHQGIIGEEVLICDNYSIINDSFLGETHIEYGYLKNGEKYLLTANNSHFTGATIMKEKNGRFSGYDSNNSNLVYQITKESVNDIWKSKGNIVSKSKIGYSVDKYNPDFPIVYIFNKDNPINTITESDGEIGTNDGEPLNGYITSEYISITIPDHSCSSLLGDPTDSETPSPAFMLTYAFKIIRYIAIIIMVVLSIMDFVSATSSQDADSIKKAVNKTIKRLIMCIIIFLLPTFIKLILGIINEKAMDICINY